jgi:Peroxiredoxin
MPTFCTLLSGSFFATEPHSTAFRQITINDLPVGRSVDETIRLIKAFQFTVCLLPVLSLDCAHSLQDKYGEVCPANWTEGSKTIKTDPVAKLEFFGSVNDPNGNGDVNGAPKKRQRVD